MTSLAYKHRQNLSSVIILSMLFSLWMAVAPMTAHAGLWDTVKTVSKKVFVTAGSLAAGAMGGVLGAAVGGGPLGMAAGGVGGYFLANKALGWATKSSANFAGLVGAVAGGALCFGMGFPMLAAGVIGGGLVSYLAVKGISKLFGKKQISLPQSDVNPEASAKESALVNDFIAKMSAKEDESASTSTPAPAATTETISAQSPSEPTISNSQDAYNKYLEAYKGYMEATQKGDAQLAQSRYAEYKKYLGMYNSFVKSGN